MAEEGSQPTQPVVDPRRLGRQNSGLSDEDMSQVILILHPITIEACVETAQIAHHSPQHILRNEDGEEVIPSTQFSESTRLAAEFEQIDPEQAREHARTIVLRLSAIPSLKNPLQGFQFGRNASRCDIVLGTSDPARRVSNVHFRIYVNQFGSVMLEDQSTNGTQVDGHQLRAKDKENGQSCQHVLRNGMEVRLITEPLDYAFIVRIPQRSDEYQEEYQANVAHYFREMQKLANRKNNKTPNDIFKQGIEYHNSTTMTKRPWTGAPKYNKEGVIGKGAFATVYKLVSKYEGKPFAAKELEKRRFMKNGNLDQKVEQEMKIMSRIKHENIVQFIEHVDWCDHFYIIMEYVPEGDLGGFLQKEGCLSEEVAKSFTAQLLSVLGYLHGMGITHRDIKPDNILIQKRNPLHVKLTDFGLSKMIENDETFLRTFCGTLLYCAPEVYTEYREYDGGKRRNRKATLPPQRYGPAVDIWSLGGVLYFALCGQPPYPASSRTTSYQELLNTIMTKALDLRPLMTKPVSVSETCVDFIKAMLKTRPAERATVEQLQNNRWLRVIPDAGDSVDVDQFESEDEDEELFDGQSELEQVASQLEEGASQLSLEDPGPEEQYLGDEVYGDVDVDVDVTVRQREIPSSFSSGDDTSVEDFSTIRAPRQAVHYSDRRAANQQTLFGEVNGGSRAAIPINILNRPLRERPRFSPSMDGASEPVLHSFEGSSPPDSYPSPPITFMPQRSPSIAQSPISAAPSLLGAESLVRDLRIKPMDSPPRDLDSPSPKIMSAPSPRKADSGPSKVPDSTTTSLRRQREDEDDLDDLPVPVKKYKSSRFIDMPLPKKVFWDARDRSTWHEDYPEMSTIQYGAWTEEAKSKGEEFVAGNPTYDRLMRSHSRSRSPSVEPERQDSFSKSAPAAPVAARPTLMKRDDRQLTESSAAKTMSPASATASTTERFSPVPAPTISTGIPQTNASEPQLFKHIPDTQDRHDNNLPGSEFKFATPRRILAKLVSTEDSIFPNMILNINDQFASWGRHPDNTMIYTDTMDTRIPKFAFKLVLCYEPSSKEAEWDEAKAKADNMRDVTADVQGRDASVRVDDLHFYISTKASSGIEINDIHIPSYEPKDTCGRNYYWGELKHGDIIQVWGIFGNKPADFDGHTAPPCKIFLKFKVNIFVGEGKQPRREGETFACLDHVAARTLDWKVGVHEKHLLEVRNLRYQEKMQKEEEQKQKEEEQQKRRAAIAKHAGSRPAAPRRYF